MNLTITSLDALAFQANENHQLAEVTAGSALEYARRSGAALVEAKALVKHGEWLGWLRANFNGSQRTAYNYITLTTKLQCVASLEPRSINEALRMIAGENEEEEEEEPEDEPEAELFDKPEDEVEPQHGEVEDEQPADEEEQEEARAVAVEIVEEDEDCAADEIGEQPDPELGVALVYARTAIDALNKIPKRDPSRKAAIKMVSDWLAKQ
jgi:hypothetical protein